MSLHVVLYQPEIPQNTGNIMRTCAATNATLHLIEPFGFSLSPSALKRYGVNYLEYVHYHTYPDYESFLKETKAKRWVFLTRYGQTRPDQIDLSNHEIEDLYLVFGRESTGIPKNILASHLEQCIRLPMTENVRSLNLANTVCTVIYEAHRQNEYQGLSLFEPDSMKGKDYLQTPEIEKK